MMKALGSSRLSRRRFLTASASLGIGTIAAPYVARAEDRGCTVHRPLFCH